MTHLLRGAAWRASASLAMIVCLLSIASAQVQIKLTPEPIIVSAIAARDMGRWTVEACNDGAMPQSISRERLSIAAGSKIRMIDDATAASIMSTETDKSFTSRLVKALGYAGQGLSVALALASKANGRWAAGLALGSSFMPMVLTTAKGYVPANAVQSSMVKYPVPLGPGDCFTDHVWAAKVKSAAVIETSVPAPGVAPVAPVAPASIVPKSALRHVAPRIIVSSEALARWDVSQVGNWFVERTHVEPPVILPSAVTWNGWEDCAPRNCAAGERASSGAGK